jgi:hypothetical protein
MFHCLTFSCHCLHYMFRPTWPSSSVWGVFSCIFFKESASLVLLARDYTLRVSSVGWVKYEVLRVLCYIFCTVIVYMFFTCLCFPVLFSLFFCFLRVCLFACLLVFSCCLPV